MGLRFPAFPLVDVSWIRPRSEDTKNIVLTTRSTQFYFTCQIKSHIRLPGSHCIIKYLVLVWDRNCFLLQEIKQI